ncbi:MULTISPECIES: hypothetical protein [unclassified Streptomyces]|uniref:hypothetical protein n=1 Tax=unclassified Streptomyces TaxID=2593676 RepID=UPI000DD95F80|nr:MULTISPECIES: hypothetical protein [unclassified Streptomyces]QZZ26581.1 hypothetical protein A7X85_10205 [Streptomyces sp. ST1015]
MTTVYVITSGAAWSGTRLTLQAAQAAGLVIEERLAFRGGWTYRWERSDRPGIWVLLHRDASQPSTWGKTGRQVRAVDLDLSGVPVEVLWQLAADALNELSGRGIPITATREQGPAYIGPNVYDGIRPARPSHCVVLADDGRWAVEDRTPRCAECDHPLPYPGMTYCSTRCHNAADRHDEAANGQDGDE